MAEYYDSVENAEAQASENKLVNRALTKMPQPYLSGMKLRADVKIGDLTLNTIDENGVVWVCTEIEGWWNVPDPEIPDLTRGWGDGSYDAIGRYTARLLVLNGIFLTQDPEQVETARAKLIENVNLVYQGKWLVVNEATPKASFVRLSGRPTITNTSARGRTEFSIQLKAADPIKYEWVEGAGDNYRVETISSGSSKVITNQGNYKVPVIFELEGPFTASSSSNVVIQKTSGETGSIELIGGISSGQSLEIDTYNREILLIEGQTVLSGRDKAEALIKWIFLEPGDNTISFSGASGKTLNVYYRSGWIG